MTGRTHAIGGVAALWLLRLVPGAIGQGMAAGPNNLGLLAGVAAFGALLPDLDARASLLSTFRLATRNPSRRGGKDSKGSGLEVAPFALPSMLLHKAFGHRGALHSLGALGIIAYGGSVLAAVGLVGWQAVAALFLGYASHLLLDACTPHGVPFLWPQRLRWHALLPRLRITTGSPAEDIAFALLALAALALVLPLLR